MQPQVFLLYCKVPPPGKTTEQFCDEVLALADLLNRSGGFKCEFDGYNTHKAIANWGVWTEDNVKESDFVLLLCSPMMSKYLKSPNHELVEMTVGKFYADSIPSYIDPKKFIPVFLNTSIQQQLVPANLQAVKHYELRVSVFISRMGDTQGMTAEQFEKQVTELLEEPVFRDIAALLAFLRREPQTPRPPQPEQPIQLPPLPQSGTVCF